MRVLVMLVSIIHIMLTCTDPERRGTAGPDRSLENHKVIGFLSNISPDPLKSHKATKPAFNAGLYLNGI